MMASLYMQIFYRSLSRLWHIFC